MNFRPEKEFALERDNQDQLRDFRDLFYFPKHEGREMYYFTGNSLGLQPKSVREFIEVELDAWERFAVEGHFQGKNPWFHYHAFTKKYLADLVGANEEEVVSMNNLTTNLHLMLTTFYRPEGKRKKIIIEAGAFPSDQYALETQLRTRGLDPDDLIIELKPTQGNHILDTESIINSIEEAGEELALVLFPGIQYYSGQFFEIGKITAAAHRVGAKAGFDLAHAIGNVPLNLHNDDVDFAVWCSYKYLNSGPGGVSGIFVHEKHGKNHSLPRLAGWWGQKEEIRFKMQKGFIPMDGADGWQLSNVNIISTAVHLASLEIFSRAGMKNIRDKSLELTSYLEFMLKDTIPFGWFEIITPSNPGFRGAQLSLLFRKNGKEIFDGITAKGISVDWREPDVIRIAPAPLYNSFSDVYEFVKCLREEIKKHE